MTAEFYPGAIDPAQLRAPLDEMSMASDDFQKFVVEVFDYFAELSDELLHRQKAWEREKGLAQEELDRCATRLSEERAELDGRWQQVLDQMRENRGSDETNRDVDESVKILLSEAEKERQTFQEALGATQSQATQISEMVGELGEIHREIAAARDEIRSHQDVGVSGSGEPVDSQMAVRLQEQLLQSEQGRSESEKERIALEGELESVRNRAADMAEAMSEQRRQLGEERTQMVGELKRMRRSMEQLAVRPMESPAPVAQAPLQPQTYAQPQPQPQVQPQAPVAQPVQPAAAVQAPTNQDPVLDSVMAQFEILQKDIARRRQTSASA